MDAELAKRRRLAGLQRHQRKIHRQVDYIFEHFPDVDNPYDFIRKYESVFGTFDFIYARAQTEFGEQFGRGLSPEDAGWGIYRPPDDPPSLEEQLKKVDEAQVAMDKYEERKSRKNRKTERRS